MRVQNPPVIVVKASHPLFSTRFVPLFRAHVVDTVV